MTSCNIIVIFTKRKIIIITLIILLIAYILWKSKYLIDLISCITRHRVKKVNTIDIVEHVTFLIRRWISKFVAFTVATNWTMAWKKTVVYQSVPTNDKQTPSPSVLIPLSWNIRNVLKWMIKQFSDICDFYFPSYRIRKWIFFLKNIRKFLNTFFFKNVQIHMKDSESAE